MDFGGRLPRHRAWYDLDDTAKHCTNSMGCTQANLNRNKDRELRKPSGDKLLWPEHGPLRTRPLQDRFPDSCFRAIVQSLSNRIQNWLDMRPTPRNMANAGPSSVHQGRFNSFPYAALPLAPKIWVLPKETQALSSKTKLVTRQQLPLNDSAGGQNATPADEKAPSC